MPKDRLTNANAARLGLGLGLAAALALMPGCRHARPEVPPERPYLSPGMTPGGAPGGAPHVGFSTEPPSGGNAYAGSSLAPGGLPGSGDPYATPPGYGGPAQGVQPTSLPAPDPLQNLPGPGVPMPPRGQMGVQGQPPAPY